MNADHHIIRFPSQHTACVWLAREGPAWLVLARDHGWLHGDYASARADALWLSKNLGLAVRRAANVAARQSP
jgi:hypothetical protein